MIQSDVYNREVSDNERGWTLLLSWCAHERRSGTLAAIRCRRCCMSRVACVIGCSLDHPRSVFAPAGGIVSTHA
jgi:hypothetical protein